MVLKENYNHGFKWSYNHGFKWSYNHGFISWHQFKEHLQVVCMLRVPLFETLDSKIRNFQVKTFWQGKIYTL